MDANCKALLGYRSPGYARQIKKRGVVRVHNSRNVIKMGDSPHKGPTPVVAAEQNGLVRANLFDEGRHMSR